MTIPRYTRQKKARDCVPTAILNTLHWAGAGIGYEKGIKHIEEMCTHPDWPDSRYLNRDWAIRELGTDLFQVEYSEGPTLGKMEKHLQKGGAILIDYFWRTETGWARHLEFVESISPSGKSFYIVNGAFKGNAHRKVSRNKFKRRELRFQQTKHKHKVWFLTLED
jgi:hypothetical protein